MKLSLVAAALLAFAVLPRANAQVPTTTYSVIKVTASLPIFYQAADNATLLKSTLTSKSMINIALDRDVDTALDPGVILGFAGEFASFGHHLPNPSAPAQLVVFNTITGQKLKTIGTIPSRTVVENRVLARTFKRVGASNLLFANTGGTDSAFYAGGALVVGGTVTRTQPDEGNPATLKVNCPTNVVGVFNLTAKRARPLPNGGMASLANALVVVSKGSLRASGKIVGTFTE